MKPIRSSQPTIYVNPLNVDFLLFDKFPIDKYEIEKCKLTNYLISKNIQQNWLVYIINSKNKQGYGDPFGFIRYNGKDTVHLYLCPYNFVVLFRLLDQLINVYKNIISLSLKQEFENYLLNIPNYYIQNLKNVFKRLGLPNIFPEHLDFNLPYSISNYMKNLKKQSKTEIDLYESQSNEQNQNGKNVLNKNIYEIDRKDLVHQLKLYQNHIFYKNEKKNNSNLISVPISQMGNYTVVLSKKEVLRDPYAIDDIISITGVQTNKYKKNTLQKRKHIEIEKVDETDLVNDNIIIKNKTEDEEILKKKKIVHNEEKKVEKTVNIQESKKSNLPFKVKNPEIKESVQDKMIPIEMRREIEKRNNFNKFLSENEGYISNIKKLIRVHPTNTLEIQNNLKSINMVNSEVLTYFLNKLIDYSNDFKKYDISKCINDFLNITLIG
jgi:hypothetical protein